MAGGKHYAKKKKKSKLSMILLIIFIAMFIYSLVMIIYWLKNNYELSKIEEEVISKVAIVNEENNINTSEPKKESLSIDFKNLESINTDVKAWIYIKNTDINYPILQTTDNEYYLKKDIYKKYSSCGSIFLDCNSKPDFSDDNTIVYGHNLKNKKMFADLSKIYKGDLGDSIEIEIYTKDTFKKYQVITAYMEEPNLDIIKRNFTEVGKKEYITKNVAKSKVKFNNSLDNSKGLLTLVTCDSTGDRRIIVTAYEK